MHIRIIGNLVETRIPQSHLYSSSDSVNLGRKGGMIDLEVGEAEMSEAEPLSKEFMGQ